MEAKRGFQGGEWLSGSSGPQGVTQSLLAGHSSHPGCIHPSTCPILPIGHVSQARLASGRAPYGCVESVAVGPGLMRLVLSPEGSPDPCPSVHLTRLALRRRSRNSAWSRACRWGSPLGPAGSPRPRSRGSSR